MDDYSSATIIIMHSLNKARFMSLSNVVQNLIMSKFYQIGKIQ